MEVINKFTFQYGQIYYHIPNASTLLVLCIYIPIWLDLLLVFESPLILRIHNLHSNMVRFIIIYKIDLPPLTLKFTFQYGQIYYIFVWFVICNIVGIYIPIWLDLLFVSNRRIFFYKHHLHSNMVRFIIYINFIYILNSFAIYIPIWLDLLSLYFTIYFAS